ncbi:MAG: discoidin domain-containing protein [Eubacterium sp.]
MKKITKEIISIVLILAMVITICPQIQLIQVMADYGTNIAKGKVTQCSGLQSEWWMYDDAGNIKPDSLKGIQSSNAVDGDANTSFSAYQDDDQWIYVDLGREYTIGRVVINWTWAAGKIYDIQVSKDAASWTTISRQMKGYAQKKDNLQVYAENVRYVRVFVYRRIEAYFGISELEVYEYKQGDPKNTEEIGALPEATVVNLGEATYLKDNIYYEYSKSTSFIDEETIDGPVESNGWWQSAVINKFSSLLCISPLKAKYSEKGLGVLTGTAGWVNPRGENDLSTSQESEKTIDFYVLPAGYDTNTGYDKVHNYGDYSVDIGLWDDSGMQMQSTFVQGNPYIFSSLGENKTAYINSSTISEIFDGKGSSILSAVGNTVTTDHIGIKSVDSENTKAENEGAYYCISVPQGTVFKTIQIGSDYKIEVTFPSTTENYMSIATMPGKSSIDTYYQHGYAFVTDTVVDYTYNESNSKVVTNYNVTTKLMRTGFVNTTMQCLFPHQWKNSGDAGFPAATYANVRGQMKGIWSNSFTTTQQFSGLLPTFSTPDSSSFSTDDCKAYLKTLEETICNKAAEADAYWEGKNIHPLAMGVLMADQLGETELKEKYIKKLKSIFVDWYNYDGEGDSCYLMYNKDWGTIYYPASQYGANGGISDHHFTYGYFVFGAAVLSVYDKEFFDDYKDMTELLIRDYADPLEPEEDGNLFCKFRNFDQYAGHSWAGGYADGDTGNNQESVSEALFSWEAMYLWGELTQNKVYKDAAAYGFATEIEAAEQYWFDYDKDNWHEDYPFNAVGILYAGSAGFGTYFGGQPLYVYGIQWLPISEFLTYYGMNQERCAEIYAGLEYDTQYAIAIEQRKNSNYNPDSYAGPDNGWQHIAWPYLSQTDPARAISKFKANAAKVQKEDQANTLWFITAMDQLGYRTNDYIVTGDVTGSVYYNKNTKKYTAEIWNPTDETQVVTIKNAQGNKAGTAQVGSRGLISFNIDTNKEFTVTQVATPRIKATSMEDGTLTDNLVGNVKLEDPQNVELFCEDSGATIYYTTDGTVPTTSSPVYHDKIAVNTDTTINAIAVKNGCIDSAYTAAQIEITSGHRSKDVNVALRKTATASSYQGTNTPASAVDGKTNTRWESKTTDNEYFQVDLGTEMEINSIKILWEPAYAETYNLQVSKDGNNWTTVASEKGLNGWVTTDFDAVKARYVRMQGIKRATGWGYSIYEFEVYEANTGKNTEPVTTAPAPTPTVTEPSTPAPSTTKAPEPSMPVTTTKAPSSEGNFEFTWEALDNTRLLPDENNLVRGANVTATASSQNAGQEAEKAIDNNKDTRWQSTTQGDEYIIIDLGKECQMNKFMMIWENAQAKDYTIEISSDGKNYTTAASIKDAQNANKKRMDTITLDSEVTGRYVKIHGTQVCAWGYALFEVGVYYEGTKVEPTTEKQSDTGKDPASEKQSDTGKDPASEQQSNAGKDPASEEDSDEVKITKPSSQVTTSEETVIPATLQAEEANSQTAGNSELTTKNIQGESSQSDTKQQKIKVKKTKIKKAVKKKVSKKASITLKKIKGVTGYQVRISTSKKFKKFKTKKFKKAKFTIKKLKANKKYYVKARTYKKINGKKFYSAWTKIRKVKIKK